MKKKASRFAPIFLNGIRSVFTPFLAILFSYVVVNFFSKELWGSFVEYLLFFLLASIVCNWGNTTYLMRSFSQNPKNISLNWQQFLVARTPICLLFVVLIPLFYEQSSTLYLILWLISAFVQNSFQALIFYNRDYWKLILVESLGFLLIIVLLYIQNNAMDIKVLIKSYAFVMAFKALLLSLYHTRFLHFKNISLNIKVLSLSFPFFLLGISGFLQSKVDVYVYSFFYKGTPLGEYQIISGFFIFSQSIFTILLFPYLKNFYRMKTKTMLKIRKLSIVYGFFLNMIITGTIYFALAFLFNIQLTVLQLSIAFFIGFPSYIYSVYVFNLFKNHKEYTVVKISTICLAINLLLSIILLYLNLNITGVLLANAVSQIICMLCYSKFKIDV